VSNYAAQYLKHNKEPKIYEEAILAVIVFSPFF